MFQKTEMANLPVEYWANRSDTHNNIHKQFHFNVAPRIKQYWEDKCTCYVQTETIKIE